MMEKMVLYGLAFIGGVTVIGTIMLLFATILNLLEKETRR